MWSNNRLQRAVTDKVPSVSVRDAAKAQAAGTIGVEEWIDKVKSGDPTA